MIDWSYQFFQPLKPKISLGKKITDDLKSIVFVSKTANTINGKK